MFGVFKRKTMTLVAPLSGKAVRLGEVPDPIYAEKMLGDGIAIWPSSNQVVAPCNGKVVQIAPTNHIVGIETNQGVDILIHVGIDTVELKGDGFTRLIEEGVYVKKGTPLLEVDFEILKKHKKSILTPIIVTNTSRVELLYTYEGTVISGETQIIKGKCNK